MRRAPSLSVLLVCAFASFSQAAIDEVPRDREAFPGASDSRSVRVQGVRVVIDPERLCSAIPGRDE